MLNPYDYIHPYVLSGMTFVGTYCLILSYQKQHEIKRTLTKGIRTTGIVTEIRENPSGKGGKAPVVEFTYPNGTYRHVSFTYRSPCHYSIGQKVDIWYKFERTYKYTALADDDPGKLPKILLRWGIILCLLTYPEIIRRLAGLGIEN